MHCLLVSRSYSPTSLQLMNVIANCKKGSSGAPKSGPQIALSLDEDSEVDDDGWPKIATEVFGGGLFKPGDAADAEDDKE